MASLNEESKLSTFILPPASYPRLKFLRNKFEPVWKKFIKNNFTLQNEKIPINIRSLLDFPRIFVITASEETTIPLHSFVQDKNVVNENQEKEINSISDFEDVTSEEIKEGIPHVFIVLLDFDTNEDGEESFLQQKQKLKRFIQGLSKILTTERFRQNSLYVIRTQGCKITDRCTILSWTQEILEEEDSDFNLQLKYRLFLSDEDYISQKISRILENNMKARVHEFVEDMKAGTQMVLEDLNDGVVKESDEILNTKVEQLDSDEDWLTLLDLSNDAKQMLTNLSKRKDLLRHFLSQTTHLLKKEKSSKLFAMSSKFDAVSVYFDGRAKSKEIALDYLSKITANEFKESIVELQTHTCTQVQSFLNDVVQIEQCFERLHMRLLEEIPHELHVIMGRTPSVMMIKKSKTSIEIYLRGENANEVKDEIRSSIYDILHDNFVVNFLPLQGNKIIKRFIGNGDQIGHYNTQIAKYGFGTIAMIAIVDGFMEKFAFTCEHVAPASNCIYGSERFVIGFTDKNHCIKTEEEYLGYMLDFSAVHLRQGVNVDMGIKDLDKVYYTPRVYEGSLSDLENQELFFYGSTSMNPKKVKYTREAIFKEEEDVHNSENEIAGKEVIRRILLLQGQEGEVVIPGDSGSLVCYKDEETDSLYAVFILIGGDTQSEDIACCRLSDCLDYLEDKGLTFTFEEQDD